MSVSHGRKAALLYDSFDITGFIKELNSAHEVEASENTTMGKDSKTYLAGLNDATASVSGYYDNADGSANEIEADINASSGPYPITASRDGLADGTPVQLLFGVPTMFEVNSVVSDVVEVSGEFQSSDGADYGHLLEGKQTISSATTIESDAIDNGGSSSGGGVAHLHVTANAHDDDLDVIVEHSADDVTYATLATFATVATTSLESQRVAVTGTVNQYVRASATGAGSGAAVYTVAFARR